MKPGKNIKQFLDRKVDEYNQPSFIQGDPICIPHLFRKKQDIEIAGLFAALFAWGNRKIIIDKCHELMVRMDSRPYDFILNHTPSDLKRLLNFRHRTFQDADLLFFIQFLNHHYTKQDSLELAFFPSSGMTAEQGLNHFRNYFFREEHLKRTEKHISSPEQRSACKRLNMYLRWMVRSDNKGVDFGLWKTISPAQLICPLDVHVARVARKLSLLARKQNDWKTAIELTESLRRLDKPDPVKYDFALFNLGINEKL